MDQETQSLYVPPKTIVYKIVTRRIICNSGMIEKDWGGGGFEEQDPEG